ncbi:MAG: helix-turn-helix domain-containing protein, partial [Muribaculaceae bacterium]|nr:helix-turn-helix domain-containing protein [Muribaculaceae bacterium]
MNAELREIHIGAAIKKRLDELEMTKSEFGRLIGVPQQHVNRIFDKESIDTIRLAKICRALDFNFFALFCRFPTNVNAYLAAVALGDGDALNNIGDTALLAQIESQKVKVANLEKTEKDLRDQISVLQRSVDQLTSQLGDKNEIINLL